VNRERIPDKWRPKMPRSLNKKNIIKNFLKFSLIILISSKIFNGCTCKGDGPTITGTIVYDFYPAVTVGGSTYLDPNAISQLPVRRAVVRLLNSSGEVVGTSSTNDSGDFSVTAAEGGDLTFEVLAHSNSTDSGSSSCTGSWDIKVVNNTKNKGLYVGQIPVTDPAAPLNLQLVVNPNSAAIADRGAAPFAILDSMLTEIEMICQANPGTSFPTLLANWSPDNVPAGPYSPSTGLITTSHYTTESGTANIYILGDYYSDADEYDRHVITHEFGHYLLDKVFGADMSPGGMHLQTDTLDPRVSFSEGFGNAVSAMTLNDPLYKDTSASFAGYGTGGFGFDISVAPTADEKTIYSEFAVHYLLWMLYENRNATANSGSFDKIFQVLNTMTTSEAMPTAQSFAALYLNLHGNTESLSTLWNTMAVYNSLCSGPCPGTLDLYDIDNDLGLVGYGTIKYPQGTGTTRATAFWQHYVSLDGAGGGAITTAVDPGILATPVGSHQDTNTGSGDPLNKFGSRKLYTFTGTGASKTITVTPPGTCPNTTTQMGIDVYYKKTKIKSALATTCNGTASVTFTTTAGAIYVIDVYNNDPNPGTAAFTYTLP